MINKYQNIIPIFTLLLLSSLFLYFFGRYGYDWSDNSFIRGYAYQLISGKKLNESLHFSLRFVLFVSSIYYKIFGQFEYTVLFERFLFYLVMALKVFITYKMFFVERGRFS